MNKKMMMVIGIIAAIVLLCVVSYTSSYNYGNKAEVQIKAEYENMENILAQYSLKVVEVAQVPGMMTDDLKEVISAGMTGRYGKDGSKAAFQFIQENYPGKVDASLYKKIQQVMEAGRNKFENAQTRFIDIKRAYETELGYLWKGMWMRIAGYPKINLSDYKIISSDHAKESFKTGVGKAIKLR